MKRLFSICVLSIFLSQPAAGEILPKEQVRVLACLENMGLKTTWGDCVNLIFADCALESVGDESHLACLADTRKDWSDANSALLVELNENLPTENVIELNRLMGEWVGYVGNKCNTVAADKTTEPEKKAAFAGCEITEFVGLSDEFAACLEGRSTAEYCQTK